MTCRREVVGVVRAPVAVGRMWVLQVDACTEPADVSANFLTNGLQNLLNGVQQLLNGRTR